MKTKAKNTTREVPSITRSEFYALLDVFIKRLEAERNVDALARHGESFRNYHKAGYDDGERFVRVWDATGLKNDDEAGRRSKGVSYFVEKDTGVIFGAKSWLQYNANREYGTLMTLDEYQWGGYYGSRKDGKPTLVPKDMRR